MNFVTVAELNNDIVNGINIIPKDIDIVVGIPRSGMMVATLIALYLNKPLTDIDSFKDGRIYTSGSTKNLTRTVKKYEEIKKALIVEDSSSSGASIKKAKEKLVNVTSIDKVFFAAYVTGDAMKNVDLYFRQIEQPRLFEWNFMHHENLLNACVDIDGVLCNDPTDEENDDGSKYVDFIYNAKPRYIPTRKIGWIVTSRLEKYRVETEKWLQKNGIEYNHLIMMNVDSAEERRRLGNHATYKANVYKKLKKATWFIESDERQAKEISHITGKPVFCVNAQYFYKGSIKNQVKRYIRYQVGRSLRKIVGFIRR